MAQAPSKEQKSEIERIVDLDRMGPSASALEIVASDSERAALAKRFGFVALPAFTARVTVDRRAESTNRKRRRSRNRLAASPCGLRSLNSLHF